MSHIAIQKWSEFLRKVKDMSQSIDRKSLLICLQEVCKELKLIKDNQVRFAYNKYLNYFEAIDFKDYQVVEKPWYSLNDLVEHNILNCRINSFAPVIVKIRDLLWLLLAYKTDIQCSRCDEDEMRVLSTKGQVTIFLCCDRCGFITNNQGEMVSETEILYPLFYKKVTDLGYCPSKDVDE